MRNSPGQVKECDVFITFWIQLVTGSLGEGCLDKGRIQIEVHGQRSDRKGVPTMYVENSKYFTIRERADGNML